MEPLSLSEVMIEVTRRCNMTCEHCLRGEQQSLDIDLAYIDILFSKIDYISSLAITGGEPSLNVDAINYIVEASKRHSVYIDNFYLATNGKNVSNDFLLSLINLYCICSDNEISGVKVSNDIYHDNIDNNADKLKVFSFVEYEKEIHNKSIINEGNAEENGIGNRENDFSFTFDDDQPARIDYAGRIALIMPIDASKYK